MILGRWWSPDEGGLDSAEVSFYSLAPDFSRLSVMMFYVVAKFADLRRFQLYCGPFIFWNVDRFFETHGGDLEKFLEEE